MSKTAGLNLISNSTEGHKGTLTVLVHVVYRVIKQVFPCFIRAPSDSNAKPIEQLYKGKV